MSFRDTDKNEALSEKWERLRSRGYWVWYFLIPVFGVAPVVRSYERHDGHVWIWLLFDAVCMVAAILKRP